MEKARYILWISSTMLALICLFWLPSSSLDRAFFSLSTKLLGPGDTFYSGSGTHKKPYQLNALASVSGKALPVPIVLDEETSEIFESNPPSPIDYAVILRELKRVGFAQVAIARDTSWEYIDPIIVTAFEQHLSADQGSLLSSRLKRSPTSQPLPTAFRRASIPALETSDFPVINSTVFEAQFLDTEKTLAGFTTLESANGSDPKQLVAVWEDRLVFHLSILITAKAFGISIEEIEVSPGEHIILGDSGPIIPIDGFGRLTSDLFSEKTKELPTYSAAQLFDLPSDHFSKNTEAIAVLMNDSSTIKSVDLDFSESFTPIVQHFWNLPTNKVVNTYVRFHSAVEVLIVFLVISLSFSIRFFNLFSEKLANYGVVFLLITLHCNMMYFAKIWPPTLAIMIGIGVVIAWNSHFLKNWKYRSKSLLFGKTEKTSHSEETQM